MPDQQPIGLWDVSWLVVPETNPGDLLAALDLSEPTPVTWRQGLAAVCGDYWDFDEDLGVHLSRVFLPPPIRGWQLVIGGWFGGQEGDERLDEVAQICRSLSGRFDRAYAFTTQGRMEFFAWTLAENGTVWRHFVWDGEVVVDSGAPVAAEQAEPSETLVAAIAGELSLNPFDLGVTDQETALGLLATTAWGREHGVPSRSLA
jgi:hypothetical protein